MVDDVIIGYIARCKKYNEELEAYKSNDHSGAGFRGDYYGRSFTGPYRSGPKRGGYYTSYHPYTRPQKFANRSVIFNNGADKTTESSKVKKVESPSHGTIDNTTPATSDQQYTESQAQTLCPGFTSTGIPAQQPSVPFFSFLPLTKPRCLYSSRMPLRPRSGETSYLQALAVQGLQEGRAMRVVSRSFTA
jgi:hypothetical protein